MLFSFKELKKIANLSDDINVNDVVNAINSIGFEVEEIYKYAEVEGIKFGKIKKIYKNPNADKLNVCEIQFDDKDRIIQTNANNVFEEMIVVAFVPGSKMGDIIFEEKEIKGIISEGMLSSLNELGIDKDLLREGMTDGIQEYKGVTLDMDPVEYLALNDHIIDVDILSNRSDAQSYIVMGKEIASYFNTNVESFKCNEANHKTSIKATSKEDESLVLIESKTDFDISLREITLLAKNKIKSINNIVDLTNLTLIMTGQPTHAYDKEKVGKEFKTGYSNKEALIFGNKNIQLDNNLVILSDNKPVSLAGVIGFEHSGVSKDTNDFILELGVFNTKETRKSLKTIKMTTQSGVQSSKALSKGTTSLAIEYISSKLTNFSKPINFINTKPIDLVFSKEEFEKVAGFEITKDDKFQKSINALKKLGFIFNGNKVTPPTYRHDIKTQQDINEEILRFYGYDNLPLIAPKISAYKATRSVNVKKQVASMKYSEVQTYTLISEEKNYFNPFGFSDSIKLRTYVSKEREFVRNSQIIPLLEIVDFNLKRNITDLSFFSMGMINKDTTTLAIASTIKDFKEMKSDMIELLPSNVVFNPTSNNNLHPGVSADIFLNNKYIGFVGKLNPKIDKTNAFVAEVIIPKNKNNVLFKEYNKDPLKNRDVTFELKNKENIDSHLKGLDVVDMKIIDHFEKDNINKVTVRFKLTDEQIKLFDEKFN